RRLQKAWLRLCERHSGGIDEVTLKFPKPEKTIRPKKPLRSRRHKHTHYNKEGHEFLYGVQEHAKRRIEIFEQAGGKVHVELDAEGNIEAVYTEKPAMCQLCENGHAVSFEDGNWVHLEKRHCDCKECGCYACKEKHSDLHHGREIL